MYNDKLYTCNTCTCTCIFLFQMGVKHDFLPSLFATVSFLLSSNSCCMSTPLVSPTISTTLDSLTESDNQWRALPAVSPLPVSAVDTSTRYWTNTVPLGAQ